MNCTQNHKIDQVTDETLVVGMDIAKRKHYACFVDARGRVLQKSFPVIQSKQGFEQLDQRIRNAKVVGSTPIIGTIKIKELPHI
ncbi:IS110 family transposase [Escherichia coli]|uniref:IS110 family transposase n=1 Tax=Escherichia coli TaxID=562 RepID=UPI001C7DFF80|nr:transposase [Escherichia coli]QZA03024.1 IS110 family transposase [Escherichia coli]